MARPFAPRFAASVALVFLLLGLVQLAASILFYQAIDRQTLRDDHARRVAEMLVVSDRIDEIAPTSMAASMSTGHLSAEVADTPRVPTPMNDASLVGIVDKIIAWEPSLANRSLHLATTGAAGGGRDLIGSIRLADGSWLNFRSRDITSRWPIALRATALTFATTLACLVIGLALLHLLSKPLRRLTDGAQAIGEGREVLIREAGPRDLRNLAHAMNVMQERITRLLQDQARSFEAISHDLRTPLSRQKIAAELLEDRELAVIIQSSVDEMEDLLASLQKFLRAQHLAASPEMVELEPLVHSVLGEFDGRATLQPGSAATVHTFREPVALALAALVENAVQFGDEARVRIERMAGHWIIAVEDDGPGIPADYFEAILDPFFRLDEARQRDTKGFGLGIPTAHRLMMRFDGKLSFGTSPRGGLIAQLQIPEPTPSRLAAPEPA